MTVLLRREDGIEAPELALVGAMIVIAVLVAFPLLLNAVGTTFESATTVMESVLDE